jgi:hypothetical protein
MLPSGRELQFTSKIVNNIKPLVGIDKKVWFNKQMIYSRGISEGFSW